MRVLLLNDSPARCPAPPRLADEQIIAGPDWPDAQTLDGKWISLRTPAGEYDLAALLAKIPAGQKPDVIVSLVDPAAASALPAATVFRTPLRLMRPVSRRRRRRAA